MPQSKFGREEEEAVYKREYEEAARNYLTLMSKIDLIKMLLTTQPVYTSTSWIRWTREELMRRVKET